jgi:hypothetical protein
MYNTDTELLFPSRIIIDLRDQRGKVWHDLVDRVINEEPTTLDHMAFVLMMARLDGCNSCNADSFRAMRGCTQCALQNVRRYRGSDEDLLRLFEKARKDLEKFHAKLQGKEENNG